MEVMPLRILRICGDRTVFASADNEGDDKVVEGDATVETTGLLLLIGDWASSIPRELLAPAIGRRTG